ncbi:Salicylate hydroxylase [Pleurostoma richardsiae]|uniref:Salicylate hydroxylase n=1 Tax=Pleurostoma richardsiae TaxID=41990 RepID=A0AA38REP4_9PEZI|nr:Salicylate hydroxylase [Pleurostoma richardsiae]
MAESNGTEGKALRIAIVGAGLVGATAAIALSRLQNVQVAVYERSSGARETGAWIAMNVSGLRILSQVLPDYSQLRQIMYQGSMGISHRHWRTGEVLAVSESLHTSPLYREGRTHRVPLHNLLLSHVPAGMIQYSKEVVAIEVTKGSVARLEFADGAMVEADLVVAADGLHSRLRRKYLPDSTPAYRGAVAYRQIFPEKLLRDIKDLPEGTSSWQKNHGEIAYMSKVGLGKYGLVAIVREDPEFAAPLRWAHALGSSGVDRLRKHFEHWDPVISKVVNRLPGIDAYRLESAPWMENMTRDAVIAFIGDAAHPTAGAYGAGATFGFGDVWALYRSLLRSVGNGENDSSGYDIPRALSMFNRIRRPFLERVEKQLQLDKKNSEYIAATQDERQWTDRWKERFSMNWWMLEHDVEAECQKVEAEVYHDRTISHRARL